MGLWGTAPDYASNWKHIIGRSVWSLNWHLRWWESRSSKRIIRSSVLNNWEIYSLRLDHSIIYWNRYVRFYKLDMISSALYALTWELFIINLILTFEKFPSHLYQRYNAEIHNSRSITHNRATKLISTLSLIRTYLKVNCIRSLLIDNIPWNCSARLINSLIIQKRSSQCLSRKKTKIPYIVKTIIIKK